LRVWWIKCPNCGLEYPYGLELECPRCGKKSAKKKEQEAPEEET